MAHILRLPPELIEVIAEDLETADLLVVRQTCKKISLGVGRLFASKLFEEKAFLLSSPSSMQTLAEISAHPVIGKALKTIILIDGNVRNPEDHYRIQHLRYIGHVARNGLRAVRQAYADLHERQERFLRGFEWRTPFYTALAALSSREVGVKLQFRSASESSSSAFCGRRQLQKELGYPNVLNPYQWSQWRYQQGFHLSLVMCENSSTIVELSSSSNFVFAPWGSPAETRDAPKLYEFAALKRLDLVLGGRQGEAVQVEVLCSLLATSPNLRVLFLDFRGPRGLLAPEFNTIAQSVTSRALTDVHFSGFRATLEDLIAFMTTHHNTLQRVKFRNVRHTGFLHDFSTRQRITEMMSKIGPTIDVSGIWGN